MPHLDKLHAYPLKTAEFTRSEQKRKIAADSGVGLPFLIFISLGILVSILFGEVCFFAELISNTSDPAHHHTINLVGTIVVVSTIVLGCAIETGIIYYIRSARRYVRNLPDNNHINRLGDTLINELNKRDLTLDNAPRACAVYDAAAHSIDTQLSMSEGRDDGISTWLTETVLPDVRKAAELDSKGLSDSAAYGLDQARKQYQIVSEASREV